VVHALGKTICNHSVIEVILFVETYVRENYLGFVPHKGRPTTTKMVTEMMQNQIVYHKRYYTMGPGYAKSAVGDVWGLYAFHNIFRDIAGLSG